MKRKTSNDFKINFKDGSDYFSSGSSSGPKINIAQDFKFISIMILSAINDCGQSIDNVDSIEVNLKIEK
tara:strand:+ start:20270 stop:20476 length:207 start_codon:yes stop_codon:yes gene_type:complete